VLTVSGCNDRAVTACHAFTTGSQPSQTLSTCLEDCARSLALAHDACVPQLTKQVAQDKELASRVNRQAYLYRVGAELHGDKFLPVEDLREAARAARSGLQGPAQVGC
jgi:hypothetical protein